MEGPDLNIVVPGVKVPLSGESAQRFIPFSLQHCSSDSPAPVRVIISVEGVRDTRIIDNVLTPSECAQLVTAIKRSDHLSFWNSDVSKKEMAKLFRDADTIEIESPEFADFIWKRIISVLDCPDIEIEDSSDPRWERELVGTWQPWSLNSDMLFARYKPGGHFAPHTDGRAIRDFNTRSFYSVILYLNTIPIGEGGGTRFYKDDVLENLKPNEQFKWTGRSEFIIETVDPVEGRMLIFDQSLVHEGVPPVGEYYKYIIRSDVLYRRTPAICDTPRDHKAYKIFRDAEKLAEAGKVQESLPLFRKAIKLSPDMAEIMGH